MAFGALSPDKQMRVAMAASCRGDIIRRSNASDRVNFFSFFGEEFGTVRFVVHISTGYTGKMAKKLASIEEDDVGESEGEYEVREWG